MIVDTLDGKQILGVIPSDRCCPPALCNIDPCDFICSFIAYLPRGPLWDYWKALRIQQIRDNSGDCDLTSDQMDNPCLTIIDHAVYTAKKLLLILQGPLQTAIWESDPLTAFNTRQLWLDNFGYVDCFESLVVSKYIEFPNPYQALCAPTQPYEPCPADDASFQMSGTIGSNPNPLVNIVEEVKAACPSNLLLATQYGILAALSRLQFGIVRTEDNINFILAPLGAKVTFSYPHDWNADTCAMECNQMSADYQYAGDNCPCGDPVQDFCVMIGDCNQMTGDLNCNPYRPCITVTLTNYTNFLTGGPGITEALTCATARLAKTSVTAHYTFDGVEMPEATDCPPGTIAGAGEIWPALMAAECILLSILPTYLNFTITRTITSL